MTYAAVSDVVTRDAGNLTSHADGEWITLPDLHLPDDDATHDICVRAAFIKEGGEPETASGDTIELLGLRFVEVGNIVGRNYYIGSVPGGTIAPGVDTTGVLTVPSKHSFPVRHVRVRCRMTGTDPTGVVVVLTNPNGDSVSLKSESGSFPNGWISDDEIEDMAPSSPLSALASGTANGAWVLSVDNDSLYDVSLVEFGLELR
jgi:hypothetical protein